MEMKGSLEKELQKIAELINRGLEKTLLIREPKQLWDAIRWLPLAGGKRLRPILALVACEAVGGKSSKAISFAIAIELLHNFTLVHDDIVDRASQRRGVQTVHLRYGESTAIFAGDALLAKAIEVTTQAQSSPKIIVQLTYKLAEVTSILCEGQEIDIEFGIKTEASLEQYLELIRRKTAVLFQLACEGGALIGNASQKALQSLSNYGLNLGMAFQIVDDCLDLIGVKTGKPPGADIREGKKTLPIIHALQNASAQDKAELLKILEKRNARQKEINHAIDILKHTNSIDWAFKLAQEKIEKAISFLTPLTQSASKQVLIDLPHFILKRRY
jgi:geranylgeranyl diphosphate synthase type I